MSTDRSFLHWPFLDDAHRELHARVEAFVEQRLGWLATEHDESPAAVDVAVRRVVAELGQAGLLQHAVATDAGRLDVRSLCLTREVLARCHGLADFAFAMQGLGSGPLSLFGTPEQRARFLPGVVAGRKVCAFALSEAEAGSDVAAMTTQARCEGEHWVIDGEKSWISNAGIADQYVVFAREPGSQGSKGVCAFVVEADNPGVSIVQRPEIVAPHPIGTVRFEGCRVPASQLIGEPGRGFAMAMATLDVFRATVGAAALGFSRAALEAAVDYAANRKLFGGTLAQLQSTQARLAEMALAVDTSALLIYRAAWVKDTTGRRISREASMAKLHATESAQQVIDAAVQIHGGRGVVRGSLPERLYREIRALRIYEGASEVQKLIIAGQLLAEHAG